MDSRVEAHITRLEGDIARQQTEIARQDAEIRRLSEANNNCERRLIEAERHWQEEIGELKTRLGQFENLRHVSSRRNPQTRTRKDDPR